MRIGSRSPLPRTQHTPQTSRLLVGLLAAFPAALSLIGCAADNDGRAPTKASSSASTPEPAPSITPTASAQSSAPASASAAPSASATPVAPAASPQGSPSERLNVVVISIDSLRADVPWLGYDRAIAPALTAFAKESVVYSRFYSISSYTAMSLGGMLAGRYPSEVSRSGYFFGNYPDSVLMFPELLQKAGVKTLTAHAHFYFDVKAGFRQGFDVYKIIPDLKVSNTTDENITSPAHLALAEEILSDKANTKEPFFAWFHFLDPHDQYMAHEGGTKWGKKARDKYDGEIEFTDQHVGKLIEFVKKNEWGKRTVIMITSDHGDAFGEHKMFRHGFELWEMLVHVPLLIQGPGIAPRRVDVPRSAIDIAPTVLELTGAPKEASFQGTSLVPELFGKEPEARDVIVDLPRTSDNDRRRALIRGQYKIMAYGDDDGFDLFDVVNDPGELKDLKRDKKDVFEEMKRAYKEKVGTITDVCPKMTEKLKGKKKKKRC